jgi:ABC-type multidrug transport system fused ATPase/permease subunit
MILMLIVPVTMLIAYFIVIQPVDSSYNSNQVVGQQSECVTSLSVISTDNSQEQLDLSRGRNYESVGIRQPSTRNHLIEGETFELRAKIHFLLSLSKYFLPLLLVYFAEYFINQGLFELVYYEEITFLDHAAQYSWFQVTYQLGVLISRSSLDLVRIKQLWTMSLLQCVNALLFLAHVCKYIHIPSFYIVIGIIVYEGLLGGFTYANTYYRMKKELTPARHEFGVSTVTIADTLGIVIG